MIPIADIMAAERERLDLYRDIAAIKRIENELRALPVDFPLRAGATGTLMAARGALLRRLFTDTPADD